MLYCNERRKNVESRAVKFNWFSFGITIPMVAALLIPLGITGNPLYLLLMIAAGLGYIPVACLFVKENEDHQGDIDDLEKERITKQNFQKNQQYWMNQAQSLKEQLKNYRKSYEQYKYAYEGMRQKGFMPLHDPEMMNNLDADNGKPHGINSKEEDQ